MNDPSTTRHPNCFPTGSLSEAKIEELIRIREAIMEKARRTVDPAGIGFDAVMQSSDDGSFFGPTEEVQFQDWLHWGEALISVISLVSQRVSLAVASAGLAVAGANMVGNERTAALGQISLAAAGVFAVWFAAVNIVRVQTKR